LTAVRAKALLGRPISRVGDYPVDWRASRWDGKKGQRPWPADAAVHGRLIAWRVGGGKRKQWLYLFTTSTLPAENVVALYGRRWLIETDLRSIKQTIRLQRISAQPADMMETELRVAMMAYNLVRAIMFQAAQCANVDPRQLSFTYARNIVLDGYPKSLAAPTVEQQEQELDRILDLVARCRFPSAPNAAPIRERCGGLAIASPSGEREKN
jgi:Transposase DDE domain